MTLKDFMKTLDRDQLGEFALCCNTSVAYLKQIASGHRRSGLNLAISIEDKSGGLVSIRELAQSDGG